LLPALGLIVGIVIEYAVEWPVELWLGLVAAVGGASIVCFAIGKGRVMAEVIACGAAVCFVCLGAVRLASYAQPRTDDIRNCVGRGRHLASIRGVLVTEPRLQRYDRWEFSRFLHSDASCSFYVRLRQVKTLNDGWAAVSGTVRVQVYEPVLDLRRGDMIEAYCWLDRFEKPGNPGEFDLQAYMARRNVFVGAEVQSREGMKVLHGSEGGIFVRLQQRIQLAARRALLADMQAGAQQEGLLEALLLGYRGEISEETYRAFRETGLLHFISLSGLHFGILLGMVWWLGKTAGLLKRSRAMICLVVAGLFLVVVPPRAPTVRAAVIGLVFCMSVIFRRRTNTVNTLSLAAIILLLIRPTQLFEAGWQLSFATVLGIILFTRPIEHLIYERMFALSRRERRRETGVPAKVAKSVGRWALRLFCVGLAAWLGGAGVLLYHFYTVNPLASLWTVIVFPLVALILMVGYLKIALAFLLPGTALVLGYLATGLSDVLVWVVRQIARLDISQVLVGAVPLVVVAGYYAVILFGRFVRMRRVFLKKAICTIGAIGIVGFLGVLKWQRTHREDLVLTCLDVSHGQAILVELPGGGNVLFDAGSMHRKDVGRRVVGAFLDWRGISQIDAVVLSHQDIDHLNGIPEVVKQCETRRVYAGRTFFTEDNRDASAEFLVRWLRDKPVRLEQLPEHIKLSETAEIRILWPRGQVLKEQLLSDNDKSVVAQIEFAGRRILLTSDIEQFGQRQVLRQFKDLASDVVVVPHHGSTNTLDPQFLEALQPGVLLCSCSKRDYERRRAAKVAWPAPCFYTACEGAICVHVHTDGIIKVVPFLR